MHFRREANRTFGRMRRLFRASFVMNTMTGERRVPFHSVMHCETSGHNQQVYLEEGYALVGPYSSQAMFDLLSRDGRFFKVGSSFIVNLNEVAEVDLADGTLTLSTGVVLSVPVRVRKSLSARLCDCDKRFQRAGRSLVVNLDNIQSSTEDAVTFANGDVVTLPVRSRKAILEGFNTWKARALP